MCSVKIHSCLRGINCRQISKLLVLPCAFGILYGCGSPGPPAPTIATMLLPGGTIGTEYGEAIQATGGAMPLVWSVSSGALPDNLTLGSSSDSMASISGMPDKVQSNVKFNITVTDAKQRSAMQSFTV